MINNSNEMTKYIIALVVVFSISKGISQNKDFNFIISVDSEINPKISSMQLTGISNDGKAIAYKLDYSPGNLSISQNDYEIMKSNVDSFKELKLGFNYHEICGENTKTYSYEIDDFKLAWIENDYFILNIINTDKKKYRRFYYPLPDRNYTYEYEYPGGATKRVQKKLTKEQRRCNN